MDAHVPERARVAGMSGAAAVPSPAPSPDIRADLLRRIAARDARDAGTWRHRLRELLRGRRFDQAADALDAELGTVPADAARPAVSGNAQASPAAGVPEREEQDTPERAYPMSELRVLMLAHFAEAIGEGASAAELYAAVSRHPGTRLPALLGLGRVLHPLGRTADAANALQDAAALQPASVEAWCNLSALRVEMGHADEALGAAARALALRPDLGVAELNRGDAFRHLGRFNDAAAAYERAVALDRRSPVALNKLSSTLRILRDFDRAESLLRSAIAMAPQYGLARVNLGMLRVERRGYAEGRALLREALTLADLDAAARAEAESALEMVDEHERLAPAIASALSAGDPEPLRKALDAGRDPARGHAAEVLERLARTMRRVEKPEADVTAIPGGTVLSDVWPGIEAHFAVHRPDSPDAVRNTLAELAAERAKSASGDEKLSMQDVVHFERAVRQRRALPPGGGTGSEAWVRYWHALITSHRPDFFPGQMKPVPNFVLLSHRVSRAAPREAAAACATFFSTQYRAVPPGLARAALVYLAVIEIHPFYDGNGRVARFLLNAELELAGLDPVVFPKAVRDAMTGALQRVRSIGDLAPILDAVAESAQFTTDLRRSLAIVPDESSAY